jgi:hypothetical protein
MKYCVEVEFSSQLLGCLLLHLQMGLDDILEKDFEHFSIEIE